MFGVTVHQNTFVTAALRAQWSLCLSLWESPVRVAAFLLFTRTRIISDNHWLLDSSSSTSTRSSTSE